MVYFVFNFNILNVSINLNSSEDMTTISYVILVFRIDNIPNI